MSKFEKLFAERPAFKTIAAAEKFAYGFIGQRYIVEHEGRFYIVSPSTARRWSLKVVGGDVAKMPCGELRSDHVGGWCGPDCEGRFTQKR